MAKKKKSVGKKGLLTRLLVSLGLVAILAFRVSLYLIAPVIENRHDMTTPPPEMERILGAATSKKNPADTVSVRVPILMYHYIEYVQDAGDKIRISLNIPPSVFESQIKTLVDAGYTFLTASELDGILAKKTPLPKKPILLTFDDGYRNFYTDAYPILKKYHVKATQYVIAGFLDRPNHLLTSQLEEIANDRLVEIGAHTMNHLWLRGMDAKTVTYEVNESRKQLQSLLHLRISSFAFPFGAFDEQAVKAVKDAGFANAMSTLPGILETDENKDFLFRLRPGWRSGETLLSYLSQKDFTPY